MLISGDGNSIRDVLVELGYSNIKEYANEYRAAPIYRSSNNNTVLSIRKGSGFWIDFAEQKTGDIADLVMLSLGLSNKEDAKNWLSGKNIYISTQQKPVQTATASPQKFDASLLLRLVKDNSFWNNRGIRDDVLEKFCGGIAYKGKLAGRYVFPIFNWKNEIIGFAGRDIFNSSQKPKWKLIGAKHEWVYPAFLSSKNIHQEKYVVLVESIGDCLGLFNAGINNVLVTFGLFLGKSIINFLIKSDVNYIIVGMNNDQRGRNGAEDISRKLSSFFDINQIHILLPDKKDFGEMSANEIQLWTQKLYQLVKSKP